MLSYLYELDKSILFFVQENLHRPELDPIMIFITKLGDMGFIWLVLAGLLCLYPKSRQAGILAFLALLVSTLLGEVILKNIFQRMRPYDSFPLVPLLIDKSSQYSFPSGHTASSFAVAFVFANYFSKKSVPIWILASLIAFSRIYLFMHYPGDILAGILLGLFSGFISVQSKAFAKNKHPF